VLVESLFCLLPVGSSTLNHLTPGPRFPLFLFKLPLLQCGVSGGLSSVASFFLPFFDLFFAWLVLCRVFCRSFFHLFDVFSSAAQSGWGSRLGDGFFL